ncbi:alkane 1-monooxygenase [Aquicoccus sp. G2-2]|uniref:alkane 1-monooxygenase n=1 Tax=Aquicoccus sp. G2-2 TaxID=3092120 RepID=UPI002ADFFB7E|nr:alkane 1-monooxygenase [Aquicoccus sp. G2-2]MEA1114146.1 alkane 1-monooxygenase [Aquicoccus sp. G2-2]
MQMLLFAIATILPIGLSLPAALQGGVWPWLMLLYMTLLTNALDRFVPRLLPDAPEGSEFPSGSALSTGLGVLHFALFAVAVAALAAETGLIAKLVTLVAIALWFGQVSHPNAHELIHRPERSARRLGRAIYASLLFGHHASAHLLVHHAHVGTTRDPNSAVAGLDFYRFFSRAWLGSLRAGFTAESTLHSRAKIAKRRLSNPFIGYGVIGLVGLAGSFALCGAKGLAAYLFLCLYTHVQILLADYVQHYGLRRTIHASGKPEPVSDAHSWNSPHWFSSALMVNAPRHSDHHLHPARPYPALRLRATMPMLPYSLPIMAGIALFRRSGTG